MGLQCKLDVTLCCDNVGDYSIYYPLNKKDDLKTNCNHMCHGFSHPRDLWLLRFAKEPSIQEFYRLLRAQLQPRIQNNLAAFMETNFSTNKLVIGVHLRGGNGKDDGMGHFKDTQRGDWLTGQEHSSKAVTMVLQHIRMIAYSVLDRYNIGGFNFNNDPTTNNPIDDMYQIFVATDTPEVLKEFQKQDPTRILTLNQPRPKDGVAIFQSANWCNNNNNSEEEEEIQCALQTQEYMLMDAFLLSSCDVLLAESYSNFLYSLPATLALAEGKIFCEAGRAALGGKYIVPHDTNSQLNLLGGDNWWANPPPNVMPVRCQTSSWAARDRSNLYAVPDVMSSSSSSSSSSSGSG